MLPWPRFLEDTRRGKGESQGHTLALRLLPQETPGSARGAHCHKATPFRAGAGVGRPETGAKGARVARVLGVRLGRHT